MALMDAIVPGIGFISLTDDPKCLTMVETAVQITVWAVCRFARTETNSGPNIKAREVYGGSDD